MIVCIFRDRSLIFCGQISSFFYFFFSSPLFVSSSRSVNDANASTSARTKPSGESIFISASFLRPNDSSASNPQTQCAYTRVNPFAQPFKGFLFGFHNSRDRRVNTCLLAGLGYISQVGKQTETSRGLRT